MAHDYVEQLEAKPASFETITNDYPQCEETTMVQDTKFWPHSLSIVPAPFLDSDHTHPSAGFEGWPGAKCAVAPAESSNLSTAAATSTPRAKSSKQPGAAAPAIPATTAHPPAPLTSRGIQHDMGIPHAPISRNLIQSTMVTVTPLLAATLSPSTLVAHSPTSHQTSQVQAISDGANINVKMDMQIPYKHGQRAPGGPPPRRCPTKPEWEMTADAMIAQVPTAYEWHNMTSTISSNLLSVKSVDQPLQPQGVIPPFEEASRFERVFTIVRTFAENHSVGTTSFQMLLLACMCNILKFQGMPEDKVAEVLRICHPEITSSSVKSYLKGVKWVNGLLENLFRTWRYRAVELIPLWGRPVTTYGMIAGMGPSMGYFVSALSRPMYYQGYQNDPWRGPTTLPLIVCRELRDEISYQDVCKALGCARLYFETNRDLYANTRYDYRDSFMSDPGSAGPHKIGNLPPISTLLNFNPSLCAPMSSSAMPLRFDGLTAMPSRPSTSVSLTRAPLAGQKRRLDSGISDDIDGVSQLRHMGDEGVFGRDEGVSAGPRPCLYGWKRGPRSRRSRKMRSA